MIKLYLDEDVHKKIAVALRVLGYDVVSAHELKNWGLSDEEQIEFAISEQRAIFTFNVGDFDRLHREYLKRGEEHFGILLSKQLPAWETQKRLTAFLYRNKADDVRGGVFWT
ncbi:MAG: DUF5615 family PIN-like protein [Planctomycetes bacterium]|nr:DUF5615 family PIN-like protein [Planctomycetota bacterium]